MSITSPNQYQACTVVRCWCLTMLACNFPVFYSYQANCGNRATEIPNMVYWTISWWGRLWIRDNFLHGPSQKEQNVESRWLGAYKKWSLVSDDRHGHLARYVQLRVAHAPGMFSPPPPVSNPDMHHGTCEMHVLWCMPGSLTSGFLCARENDPGECATRNFTYLLRGSWNKCQIS